jgi:hypothetical protein
VWGPSQILPWLGLSTNSTRAANETAGGAPPIRHRLETAAQVTLLRLPVPGLTQRTAANRCAQNGAPVFRARGRSRQERCSCLCGRERCCGCGVFTRAQHRGCATPISPAAACRCATRCGTIRRRTSAGAIFIAEGNVSCGVSAVLRYIRCARTPPQRNCRSLGDQVPGRCSLCALSFSHCSPTTARLHRCRFRAKMALHYAHVRSRPAHCACAQGGHDLARMGTNAPLRYCSAPISAATWVLAAFETLGSSSAPWDRCPGAGNCCGAESSVGQAPRPLNYRLSDAVSAHVAARNGGAPVLGAKGCLKHRRRSAAALCCSIMLGCSRMLCRR